MLTVNTLIKEIKNIPVEKLEEVYRFIHSLNHKPAKSASAKHKIMSYAGIFGDLSENDYQDFLSEVKNIRGDLFSR